MKNALIASALIFGASAAHATTTCGTLKQVARAPQCNPGAICSHMLQVVNVLEQGAQEIELQTNSSQVVARMSQYRNLLVCVDGSYSNGIFFVQNLNLSETLQ